MQAFIQTLIKILAKSNSYEEFEKRLNDCGSHSERLFFIFAQSYLATVKRFRVKELWSWNSLPNVFKNPSITYNPVQFKLGFFKSNSGYFSAYYVEYINNNQAKTKAKIANPFFSIKRLNKRVVITNSIDLRINNYSKSNYTVINRKNLTRLKAANFSRMVDWLKNQQVYIVEDKTCSPLKKNEPVSDLEEKQWLVNYNQMLDYKNKYGHCFLPPDKAYSNLNKWLKQQLSDFNNRMLLSHRLEKLQQIGVIPNEEGKTDWDICFQQLMQFKKNNFSNLPEKLRHWLVLNKRATRTNTLTSDKRNLFVTAGLLKPTIKYDWNKMYRSLLCFKQQYGHCKVPTGYPPKPALHHWLYYQKKAYQKGLLTTDKINQLKSIGLLLENTGPDRKEILWQTKFNQMVAFKNTHGHCSPSTKEKSLYPWARAQRTAYLKNKLSSERFQKLNEIGFVFDKIQWGKVFQALSDKKKLSYLKSHFLQSKTIGEWFYFLLLKQIEMAMAARDNKRINQYKKTNTHQSRWQARFNQLMNFKQEYGHCNVPINYKDRKLARWVSVMRKSYKKNCLSQERIKLLEAIGFCWSPQKASWTKRYQQLVLFKKKFGHTKVTHSLSEDKGFVIWVHIQRSYYHANKLSSERKKLLDELYF